jgi:plastocyanin
LKINKIIFETSIAVVVTVTSFALNGTRTTPTTIIAATSTKAASSSNNKIFYLFSAEIEEVDEEKLGISDDVYSLPIMIVNKGDTVTVHFHNLEKDARERYSFTIEASYNINKDLAAGQNAEATFTADNEGIFQYFDKYHPQTITGQLVVLVVLSKGKLRAVPN